MNTIISPPNRVVFERDHWYLYFDPVNIVWVKVNEDGKKILSEIENTKNPDTALANLRKNYGADEIVIQEFFSHLIEKAKYLHREQYHPQPVAFPPKNKIPRTIYLHPSYQCNLKCKYCYNKTDRLLACSQNHPKELTINDYKQLFTEAFQLGIKQLVFTGGEPLIREDIFEIARISQDMGFHNGIITNGTLITKRKAMALIKYFNKISISIDSSIETENDSMRGENTYKCALQGIHYLRELGAQVTCLAVIHPGIVANIKNSWDFFVTRLGCLAFVPQAYIPLEFETWEQEKLHEFVIKYGQMRNQLLQLITNKPGLKLINHCGMCSGEMAIGADGNVFPCQSLLKKELCGGNIHTDSLAHILDKSPIFEKLRSLTVDDWQECQSCLFKYLCGGGCWAYHFNQSEASLKLNQCYCAINKELIVNKMFSHSTISISGD